MLHVALAAALFVAGRAQLAPSLVNRDGIMESFAFDSLEYRREAVRLAGVLKEGGVGAWARDSEPVHVKLIAVQFALLGPLFGYSTLSAEPFNLLCYVAILCLVLLLGREVGGQRVGLAAAATVALWPTFLLHTTQFLKDPLFIVGALALMLAVTTWLTRVYGRADAARWTGLLLAAAGLLLLIRFNFAGFILAIAFLGFALLVVRQVLERRLLRWNLVCPLLILVAGSLAAYQVAADGSKLKRYPSDQSGQSKAVAGPWRQVAGVVSYTAPLKTKRPPTLADRISGAAETIAVGVGGARHKFNSSGPEAGSAIDRDVEINSFKALISYLPRAAAIGFWAPFPHTWLSSGERVGAAGRLVSAGETLLIYLCQWLALLAAGRAPRRLANWLLLSVYAFGVTALGLVVSNVGTLYRFRYLFWMLLIVLAAKGLESLLTARVADGAGARPFPSGGKLSMK